jgi:hypothetical protein
MALPNNIIDREKAKFRETDDGQTKVAVSMEGDSGLLEGVSYDDIQAEFATSTITNYKYYKDAVLVATVQVTFTNSSKSDVLRVRRL